jgi:hypothetical protein
MGGSQGFGRGDRGPALPGMENLGADALMMGGIEEASEIPAGMEFVMSSVPDGSVEMQVASNSKGESTSLLCEMFLIIQNSLGYRTMIDPPICLAVVGVFYHEFSSSCPTFVQCQL